MHLSPTPAPPAARSATPTPLKAALWDLDGTLVDSEPYWIAAEIELVTAHGGHWDAAQGQRLVGKALGDSAAILQAAGVDLPVRAIIDFLTGRVIAAIRRDLPWRPGAQELLQELHAAGVRCALVTMSEAAMAQVVVAALPAPYFEFLITGDQVVHGKPHPEPYLRAVARLQETDPTLSLEHCVALEDSVPGVASARAAGLPTIAIPHVVALPDDAGRTTWSTLSGKHHADVAAVVARQGAAHE